VRFAQIPPSLEAMTLAANMAMVKAQYLTRDVAASPVLVHPERGDAVRWINDVVSAHPCISSQTRDR